MKIAQVAPLYEAVPPRLYGGTERIVAHLTDALVELGHDVVLFASADARTKARLVPVRNQAIRLDPHPFKSDLAAHLCMLQEVHLRENEFDVIHFHVDLLHFPFFEKLAHKTVTTLHGRLDLEDLPDAYARWPQYPLVSISNDQRLPLPAANWVRTIQHGLSEELLGIMPGPKGGYLAFLGRISPEKRPDRAIAIARRAGLKLKIAAKVDAVDRAYFTDVIEPLLAHPGIDFVGEISLQVEGEVWPIGRPPSEGAGRRERQAGGPMIVVITLSPRDYDAVLFDLDGVLTRTASVHASAWKKLFDGFLEQRATQSGEPFVPFDIDADYLRYVDGKPRYDGVAAFLESRGIELPLGAPDDGPDVQSVRALGNLKDRYFLQHLQQHGVDPYEASIALVRTLRAQEIKTAVVSSSNNCAAVLEAAGIAQLFDARVDGTDITRLGLKGKPAPDAFLEAARRVGAEPSRAVVVEDAIAGAEAGRAGRFGCVIGVDRRGHAKALRDAGADVVVTDLAQVRVAAEPPSAWSLVFEGFDPAQEGIREALCTLGNGYFATRGAAAGAVADDVHYPGTYLAGGYNRLRTDIAGRVVENEDLVNCPNWLALEFRIAGQDWFDARTVKLLSYRQELDLRRGVLARSISFEDGQGRRSTLEERRLVSMGDMHLGALELALTADNWSAAVTVRSAIDGRVVNAGAKLYRRFNNQHLEPLAGEVVGEDGLCLLVRSCQSHIHVAQVGANAGVPRRPAARGPSAG